MRMKIYSIIIVMLLFLSGEIIASKPIINVRDYGAVGDGITDYGPAIDAAFADDTKLRGNVIVSFENKIYHIGEKVPRCITLILKILMVW